MSHEATCCVVGFQFSPDLSRVILIDKKRPTWQVGKLNGAGGHIEVGEKPIRAMTREFLEETGISTAPSQWQERVVLLHKDWVVYFFYSIHDGVQSLLQSTDELVGWYQTKQLPNHALPNLRWLIPLMLDAVEFPILLRDVGTYDT